jgi:hypothetical protein
MRVREGGKVSVTLPADYKQGNWVPATNPCPECAEAGWMEVREVLVAKPLGTFSLSGTQMKVSASWGWEFRCGKCGATGSAAPKTEVRGEQA